MLTLLDNCRYNVRTLDAVDTAPEASVSRKVSSYETDHVLEVRSVGQVTKLWQAEDLSDLKIRILASAPCDFRC